MNNYNKCIVNIAKYLAVIISSVAMYTAASASDIVWTNVFTEDNTGYSQWNLGDFADRASISDGRFVLRSPSNAANTNIFTKEKFDGENSEGDAVSLKLTVESFYFKAGWNHGTAYGRIGLGTIFAIDLYTYGTTGRLWFNGDSYSLNSNLLNATYGEGSTRIGVSNLEMLYYAGTQQLVVSVSGAEIFNQVMNAPLDLGTGVALGIFYNVQYSGGLVDYGRIGNITMDYGTTSVPESGTLALLLGGASIIAACAVKQRHRKLVR